jgi:hypothetical protein
MKAIADVLWQTQFNWSIRIMVGCITLLICSLNLWLFENGTAPIVINSLGITISVSLILWKIFEKQKSKSKKDVFKG